MEKKHFELTAETKVNIFGITLFRIKATVKTKYADIGDIGGWVESPENLSGNAWVFGDAEVFGNARVFGDAEVFGDAWVFGDADYCCFQSFGSVGRTTTVFRDKSGNIRIKCGCFDGDLEAFSKKVEQTHGDSQHGKVYKAIIEVIKLKFDIK